MVDQLLLLPRWLHDLGTMTQLIPWRWTPQRDPKSCLPMSCNQQAAYDATPWFAESAGHGCQGNNSLSSSRIPNLVLCCNFWQQFSVWGLVRRTWLWSMGRKYMIYAFLHSKLSTCFNFAERLWSCLCLPVAWVHIPWEQAIKGINYEATRLKAPKNGPVTPVAKVALCCDLKFLESACICRHDALALNNWSQTRMMHIIPPCNHWDAFQRPLVENGQGLAFVMRLWRDLSKQAQCKYD